MSGVVGGGTLQLGGLAVLRFFPDSLCGVLTAGRLTVRSSLRWVSV